jgi:hypothetical protein
MQGTGERGRDVIVYSTSGALEEVIQCKLLQDRIALPATRAELVKLALHHYLQPAILGNGPIIYELWCPPGFSEPAAELLDLWPKGWDEASVLPAVEEAKKNYKGLKNIDWATAKDSVLNKFPTLVRPKKVTGVDVAVQVRSNIPVYEAFFEGTVVMKRDDVGAFLKDYFAAGNIRQITADDTRHLVDRIERIPSARRLYLGYGYLMGMKPELFGFMTSEQRAKLCAAVFGGVTEVVSVLASAGQIVCRKLVEQIRRVGKHDHPGFVLVAYQFLIMNMSARVNDLILPGLKLQPDLVAYQAQPLQQQLEQHVAQFIAEFHPTAEAVAVLRADLARNDATLQLALKELQELIPNEIVIVGDTVTAFEKEALMSRMIHSLQKIDTILKPAEDGSETK